jgi:hypothetical protein
MTNFSGQKEKNVINNTKSNLHEISQLLLGILLSIFLSIYVTIYASY